MKKIDLISEIQSHIGAENWHKARDVLEQELNTHEQKFIVEFAMKCAYLVLPEFEKKHPKDIRPRAAIGAAEKWIAEPTEENRKAANVDAANAANAASAASAAAYAANAAAYAAYTAAERKSTWLKIIGIYQNQVRALKLSQI